MHHAITAPIERQVETMEKELTLTQACLQFFEVYGEMVTVGELDQPEIGWLQPISLLILADAKASKNQTNYDKYMNKRATATCAACSITPAESENLKEMPQMHPSAIDV